MLDDYVLFAEVVEQGGLSAAARRLRLSPGMVSKRLTRLEQRLGARLIQRTTRRMATTEAGQQFYEDVARVLQAARDAEDRVGGVARGPSGLLRVSAPTSFGRLHLAPHMGRFLSAWPRVKLDLQLTDDVVDLMDNRLDVAIRIATPPESGLSVHRLAANRRVICASPAYVAAHGAPERIEDLVRHPLLAAAGQLPWRLEGPKGLRMLDGESLVVTNSSEVVRELCLAGVGVALRSTWDVGDDLRAGRLVALLPDYRGASDVCIFAVHPASPLVAPTLAAFLDFARNLFAEPVWDAGI